MTDLIEITYEKYCMYGASFNTKQLVKKDLYAANGRFVKTRYYYKYGTGEMYHPLPNMTGPVGIKSKVKF